MNIKNIPSNYKSIINKLVTIATKYNFVIYAVGGFVRDIILNREPNDLDIMVEGENAGIEFSKIVAKELNIHPPITFEKFATSKLIVEDKEIEFIMPRKEYYKTNSRNPETEIGSLEQDALRRDFTINALFLRLNDYKLLDLTNMGLSDIQNKIIRVTDESASDIIFEQDPLRILRAIRQSLQLNFSIDKKTYCSMANKSHRITIVSGERIRDELNKILLLPNCKKAFDMFDEIGLLKEILPELKDTQNITQPIQYHDKDVYNHTLEVLDRIKPTITLKLSALFHDLGKTLTKETNNGKISFIGHESVSEKIAKDIMLRLKYSSELIEKVAFLVKHHLYPKMYTSNWSDSAIRRFEKEIGDNIDNIRELTIADSKEFNNELFDRVEALKSKKLLLPKEELFNGNELIKIFNLAPGKWLSKAKATLMEYQLENPLITKEEALKKLKKIIAR